MGHGTPSSSGDPGAECEGPVALSSETPQADSASFRPEPRCPVTLSSHPEMGGLLGPSWFHVVVSAAWQRALDVCLVQLKN